jgi:hypothetical protein
MYETGMQAKGNLAILDGIAYLLKFRRTHTQIVPILPQVAVR